MRTMANIKEVNIEVVKIPRFTLWNDESAVFEQLQRFSWMCSKLFSSRSATQRESPAVFVLRKLSETTQLAVEDLQNLFRLLKEVAFQFREPEKTDTVTSRRLCREPIISDEMYSKWCRQKRLLKKAIKEHEIAYDELRQRQKNCIEALKKARKYKDLMDIATELEDCDADTEDVSDHKATIEQIQHRLVRKEASQEKSIRLYGRALRQEQEIRRTLLDLADNLETEIRQRMRDKIDLGLTYLKLAATFNIFLDADSVARNVYSVICRKYYFHIPREGDDFDSLREPLSIPWHEESEFMAPDDEFTYGYGKLGMVVSGNNTEEKSYLKLSKDDIVKQKLTSSDGSMGFGWTRPTAFSLKKWGFYPTDALFFA